MAKVRYTSTCHLVTSERGAVWPDTEGNRTRGLQTVVELDPREAERYGKELVELDAGESPRNKQVTETRTK